MAKQREQVFVSRKEAIKLLLDTNGKIFTVVFRKRSDDSFRLINGRLEVKKHLHGGEPAYDFEEKGLIPVYEFPWPLHDIEGGYRSIPKEKIVKVTIGRKDYVINSEE